MLIAKFYRNRWHLLIRKESKEQTSPSRVQIFERQTTLSRVRYKDDVIPWCCNHCILHALPFRNATNSEFLEQHQFCSKSNLTLQLDPNELNELFVDNSIHLSNVNDIDYIYFSENSENIIANMQTQSSSILITMHNKFKVFASFF